MKKTVRLLLCFFIFLLLTSTSLAQKQRHRHVAPAWGAAEVFSNLDLEAETGDVGGMEVILSPSYYGLWATVIIASGVAEDPVLVRVTDDHYPNIEFTLPPTEQDGEAEKFTGRISRSGLTLWHRGERYGLLRRQCRSRP
jgi:hypothetical protein